jgi:cyclophilin family peptidyl-prolyl cis-trans isomerase
MTVSAVGLAASLAIALTAPPSITVDGHFHGVGRPVTARVARGDVTGPLTLRLLDAGGTLKATVPIEADVEFDLAKAIPSLRDLTVAHWLQLTAGDRSVGTPWVVQPLISRLPVRTASALRPDGKTPYTRVIGWGETLLEPDNAEYRTLKEAWPKPDPTPFSGWRIYEDRDVVLQTTLGDIRVALAPDRAPNTAWNFRSLAENGLYDGTPFHRVVKFDREGRPFVIQGGDPTGTGDGSAGYDLPLEPSDLEHDFGVISMARNDAPDTAGSQFFFALSREGTARLDHQYCAFGWAVSGAEAIVTIADGEIADLATGRPKEPAIVTKAAVVPAPPRVQGKGRPDRRVSVEDVKPKDDAPKREPDR